MDFSTTSRAHSMKPLGGALKVRFFSVTIRAGRLRHRQAERQLFQRIQAGVEPQNRTWQHRNEAAPHAQDIAQMNENVVSVICAAGNPPRGTPGDSRSPCVSESVYQRRN